MGKCKYGDRMSGYIDVDEFRRVMYHEAFETDSDLQKWDSGCWIRYKMFENAIKNFPIADVVPVVRCKDCKWGKETCGNIECFVDLNAPSEYHGYDWYCPNGEKVSE